MPKRESEIRIPDEVRKAAASEVNRDPTRTAYETADAVLRAALSAWGATEFTMEGSGAERRTWGQVVTPWWPGKADHAE